MVAVVACVVLGAASEQPAIVLIYGFQPVPGFRATQIWKTFAEHFSGNDVANTVSITAADGHEFYLLEAIDAEHRDVILSNPASALEPTVRDIFHYVRRFAEEIAALSSRRSMTCFDVVAHSMGGLIARAYIEASDFGSNAGYTYGGEIRTLVMLATPNHGSEVAALGEWFTTLSRQMAPRSDFLRTLNALQWVDGKISGVSPDVRYVSVAGQTCLGCGLRINEEVCLQACVDEALAWSGSDLVVTMSSAYLPEAENCAAIGYDHVAMHTDPDLARAIADILVSAVAPAVIYADGYESYQRP